MFSKAKMKNKKNVSIIISFKGRENLISLRRSIDSLFRQTYKPQEFIIVGTQDDLGDLEMNSNHPVKKILISADKNEAKNAGIIKAQGEFILYIDHDMVADRKLIEDCISLTNTYDALIIPERIYGNGFWQRCRDLEKKLLTLDSVATAPRFYKRSIFKSNEKPFDSRFGLLDEWGFNYNIRKKNINIGFSNRFIKIQDTNFSLLNHLKYRFNMGLWIGNFSRIDRLAAYRRINPLKRGIFFYGTRLKFLILDPVLFTGLIFLKFLELLAFFTGLFLVKAKNIYE